MLKACFLSLFLGMEVRNSMRCICTYMIYDKWITNILSCIFAFLNLFQTLDVFVTRYYRQHSYPFVNENLQLGISVGWLVGCFGLSGPLRQYFSLYQAVSREREKEERKDRGE